MDIIFQHCQHTRMQKKLGVWSLLVVSRHFMHHRYMSTTRFCFGVWHPSRMSWLFRILVISHFLVLLAIQNSTPLHTSVKPLDSLLFLA